MHKSTENLILCVFFFFSNQISELSLPLCLAELRVLDVSKNQVKMVSDNFLTECLKMETFIASANQISKSAQLFKPNMNLADVTYAAWAIG